MSRRAIGYVRVSTAEQALSPDAQRAALQHWCAANRVELVAVHEDLGVSGATPVDERPGLRAALDDLAREAAAILLVQRRDRLARDIVVAGVVEAWAKRHGAEVLTTDGPSSPADEPAAWLLRAMSDVIAQFERLVISSRTRAALAVKRDRGEYTGGAVPWGWRLDEDGVHLVEHPGEQAALERVRQLRAAGRSIRGIAADLEAEGYTPRGQRWHATTVAQLLRRLDGAEE